MTFKEAVDKMRGMNLPYAVLQTEHRFSTNKDNPESINYGIYTERHGGLWVYGPTWEAAFVLLEEEIRVRISPKLSVVATEGEPL